MTTFDEGEIGPIKAVVMIGPPGSGKGTHGRALGTLPGFYHLSMGEVFRRLEPWDAKSAGWKQMVEDCARRGDLLPDEAAVEVLARWIKTVDMKEQQALWLLDGIPRTGHQVMALEKWVDVQRVLLFECDEEVIVERIRQRAEREGRLDDQSEKVIRHRMEIYRLHLPEVMAHYKEALVRRINTMQPMLEVLAQVARAIAT